MKLRFLTKNEMVYTFPKKFLHYFCARSSVAKFSSPPYFLGLNDREWSGKRHLVALIRMIPVRHLYDVIEAHLVPKVRKAGGGMIGLKRGRSDNLHGRRKREGSGTSTNYLPFGGVLFVMGPMMWTSHRAENMPV